MRPPKADTVVALVCEDIRLEASARLSLMGVFGPIIDVPGFPGAMPMLCAVGLVKNPAEPLETVTMTIIDPNGATLGSSDTQPVAKINDEQVLHQFQIKVAPFPIQGEGIWTFRFTFNGSDEVGMETQVKVRKLRPTATS
jgi:hypothetical protein